ncbi:hypothetical protein DAMDJJ_28090 [Cupriavidus necator]|uniref:hypothetical protein n=1 Tax=Cupriavidus necator TaxID=106590 RepID=UPI003F739A88
MRTNPLAFAATAPIETVPFSSLEGVIEAGGPGLQLDKLPAGVVAGNTLIDYSGTASDEMRSAVSLAMVFAGRVAAKQVGKDAPEDEWLAAYQTALGQLGFSVGGTAMQRARFSKKGLLVHNAIIPFLTIALGGAGVGPVILAALHNLQEMDKDRPWVTLFDRESRRHESRELHFAAIASDSTTTTIRHVIARLAYEATTTNVLFLKIDDVTAEFESATTQIIGNNQLLATIAPKLRERMEQDIGGYIATVGDI